MPYISIVQSKAQLKSVLQYSRSKRVYTNVKYLSDHGCIYVPSLILALMLFLPMPLNIGDVRSSLTQIRLFMFPRKTVVFSDGLSNVVAEEAMRDKNGLYYSYKGMSFISSFLGRHAVWPEHFVSFTPPKVFKTSEFTYFIGQALSENGLISRSKEISCILMAKFDYYISHPKDSAAKLADLSHSGINVLEILEPAEDYLLRNGFKLLIGFSSSVLWNLRGSKRLNILSIEYENSWLGIDCKKAELILLKSCKQVY